MVILTPNQALDPTTSAVTPCAPSRTRRASRGRGSSLTLGNTMRYYLNLLFLVLAASLCGCGSTGYVPNGLHLGGGGGGYLDRKSPSPDIFIAEYWSPDDMYLKSDFALLRVLERAYRAGFRYYTIVERTTIRNSDIYMTTHEPRCSIRAYRDFAIGSDVHEIIETIRIIEKRRSVCLPGIE